MNEYWVFAICAAVFALQLLLCFRCKSRLLRLLPLLLPVLLGAVCFALFYATDGNWAWLLVAVILQNGTCTAAAAWLVYGGYRFAKKYLPLSSKNT